MESIATISLINLALDLSIDWKMLGRYLKLHQEVSSICVDYEEVAEQAYRMLQLWRGKNGTQATYQALGKALKQVPRNDLVEDYCIGKNKDFLDQGIQIQGLKTGEVSNSDLTSIAKELGIKWVWVGRLLGLEDFLLDSIRMEQNRVSDCNYEMLQSWRKEKGTEATYECLARALSHRAVGMRNVAEKFCVENQEKKLGEGTTPRPLDEEMENLALASSPENNFETAVAGTDR